MEESPKPRMEITKGFWIPDLFRLRELLRTKLAQLGCNPDEFGVHSLQAGGPMKAANAGVPDRLFKHHGRWKSEAAKDGYIEDSVEN